MSKKRSGGKIWTPEEDAIILSNMSLKDKLRKLNCTSSQLYRRKTILELGSDDQEYRRWTSEEDELVLSDLPVNEICIRINRSQQSVYHRRRKLKVDKSCSYWTPEEDELIFSGLPIAEICSQLKRPKEAVYRRRSRLGLSKKHSMCRPWTEKEIALVLDETKSNEEISKLTERSTLAIKEKRSKMCGHTSFSKKFWSKADDDLIREGKLSDREIASLVQFSEEQVAERRRALNGPYRNGRRWTHEEDDALRNNRKTDRELAIELERTTEAVRLRRRALAGRKNKYDPELNSKRNNCYMYPGRPWTEDEDVLVVAHEIPDKELSPIIQRTIPAIRGRRYNLRKMFPDSV